MHGLTFLQAINRVEWRQERPGRIRPPWNAQGDQTPAVALFACDDGHNVADRPILDLQPEDSGLFRNFAQMEPTLDNILAFANRYGSLWMTSNGPYAEWEFEIRTMRFLLDVWEAVAAGKRGGVISEHFEADEAGSVRMPFGEGRFGNSILVYRPFAWKQTKETQFGAEFGGAFILGPVIAWNGKPIDAAEHFLRNAINSRLGALRPAISVEKSRLAICPQDLLGALWVQFALAVIESKEFRACEVCGSQFELEPEINRVSRHYCSNACRVKAYRLRKQTALRLHKGGKTLKQIADKLDSDVATVRKWLKAKGE